MEVSVRRRSLVDSSTTLGVQRDTSLLTTTGTRTLLPTTPYESILEELPSIAKPYRLEVASQHNVELQIMTSGQLAFSRPRRLFGERLEMARREFEHMLALGIIRPSSSCWAPPPYGPKGRLS